MVTQLPTRQDKNPEVRIKRVYFWNIIWFTKLNLMIHKEDPIFSHAMRSFWNKLKFSVNFGWKLFWQRKYVLLEDNKRAGALALEERKKSIFVYAVGVLEPYKRKGYGTKMMKFTEDFARKREKKFVCFSVLLKNYPAMALYRKLGYRSLGLGLTLIRYFLSSLAKDFPASNQPRITFKKVHKIRKIKEKALYWWVKEAEALCGKEITELCFSDFQLLVDFRKNWSVYEILTNEKVCGLIAILPSFKTLNILFFSEPSTWDMSWTNAFLHSLIKLDDENIPLIKLDNYSLERNHKRFGFIQIFLTHQHKDKLGVKNQPKKFVHQSHEDRQILYKKID
ncbi:MAG: GNAT family N-acetyltransferase [Candidatus Heimdallarchaeota archaeon]|nr:GNAT family N-acetyltransferase [Candidatus Heimdallarchaeota archaeon]